MKQGMIFFLYSPVTQYIQTTDSPLSPFTSSTYALSPGPLLLHFLKEGFIIQCDHQGRNKGEHPMSHPLNTKVIFRNMYGRIKDEGKGFS